MQEVILGTYRVGEKVKLACACKDVRKEGEELHEFSKMQLSDLSLSRKSKSILLDDVCDAISRNQYVDPKEMLEFYYKQFVFDALIGNTDRHNGNWGVLADKDGNCRMCPIFDCGSSLDPLVPEEEMKALEFKTGAEMRKTVVDNCIDIYNPVSGLYVFLYNDDGSVCVYYMDPEEAYNTAKEAEECGEESWSGVLGWGGEIFDDPTYEDYRPGSKTNDQFFEEATGDSWYVCSEWYAKEKLRNN